MINRFINWKKNIETKQWDGLSVYFDTSLTSFDEVWLIISKLIVSMQPSIFTQNLIKGNVIHEESEYSKIISLEENNYNRYKEYISIALLKQSDVSNSEKIIFQIQTEKIHKKFIDEVILLKGMYYAYLYNENFYSWENNKRPRGYKYTGGLKVYFNEGFQMKMVDISDRPGRYTDTEKYRFQGASEYWISQEIITEAELRTIPHIEINRIASTNITHIKLFELPTYWEDSSQNKIAQLRKLLDIDAKINRE